MAEDPPPEAFAADEGRPPGADGTAGRPRQQGSTLRPLGNPPRRRLPARAALGVALVVGGALTFGLIQLQLTGSRSVLAAARDVASGHVIQSCDLRVVNVGMAEGITPIASSDQDSVLGHTARVDILSGALLTAGDIGTASVAGGDEAIHADDEHVGSC